MNIIKRIIMKISNLDPEPCESCETLKEQLNISNYEKKQMLETILSFTKPAVIEKEDNTRMIEPIQPRAVTWRVRQQALEENDRAKAQEIKRRQADIDALEKELKIEPEVKENAS